MAEAAEDVEQTETESVTLDEPQDYWEKEAVANQIANFNDIPAKAVGDDMPMLVAVRVRPLWDKARGPPPPPVF